MSKAYLLGAMHDGTIRRRTLRISQREKEYILSVQRLIVSLGGNAWIYREGQTRELFVVEFARSFLDSCVVRTRKEIIGYIRGYFDAEGGIPVIADERPYLYFAQEKKADLTALWLMLIWVGIDCVRIHNPSRRADPDYWRFFVRRSSIPASIRRVGSWHPRKARLLDMMQMRLARDRNERRVDSAKPGLVDDVRLR